jgi:hypothetical protein
VHVPVSSFDRLLAYWHASSCVVAQVETQPKSNTTYCYWAGDWWLVVVSRVYHLASPLPQLLRLYDLDFPLPALHCEQTRITATGEEAYDSWMDRKTDESKMTEVNARRNLHTLYWKHS